MMSRTKKYITAATTFSAALGIGFVVQYGDAVASRLGADSPVTGPETRDQVEAIVPVSASVAAPQAITAPQVRATPHVVPAITKFPADQDAPAIVLPAVATEPTIPTIVAPTQPDAPDVTQAATCESTMDAVAGHAAMVTLTLAAPCYPNAVVAIHHQGMMFNMVTDDKGALTVEVPALDKDAFFIAAFDDGKGAVALTTVADLALYDRAVLQWQGEADVQLHALEFGAGYADKGHLWAASTGDTFATSVGTGGFISELGSGNSISGMKAEVYSFPTGLASIQGDIKLNVEAEVTARNCGRDIAAETIQVGPDMQSSVADLTMRMPACDAIGDFLVLKNMFEDLTIATR